MSPSLDYSRETTITSGPIFGEPTNRYHKMMAGKSPTGAQVSTVMDDFLHYEFERWVFPKVAHVSIKVNTANAPVFKCA